MLFTGPRRATITDLIEMSSGDRRNSDSKQKPPLGTDFHSIFTPAARREPIIKQPTSTSPADVCLTNRYSIKSDKQIQPIISGAGLRLIDRDIVLLPLESFLRLHLRASCTVFIYDGSVSQIAENSYRI